MDGAAYTAGRRVPGHLTMDDAWRWHERDDLPEEAFVWVGLLMPSPAEVATAQKMFDLHELAVEDALGDHVRPKLEIYDETLFMVLRTARYNRPRSELNLGEISVFLGRTSWCPFATARPARCRASGRRRSAGPTCWPSAPAPCSTPSPTGWSTTTDPCSTPWSSVSASSNETCSATPVSNRLVRSTISSARCWI